MPYFPHVECHIINGSTLIIGTNSYSTSPKWRKRHADGNESCSRHAEEHALAQLPHDVNPLRLKVRVYRWKKDGSLAMAKPCHHCMAKLMDKGIRARQISFTNEQGQLEKLR